VARRCSANGSRHCLPPADLRASGAQASFPHAGARDALACHPGEVVIIDVSALADALIERLNPELPEGCRLERGSSESWGGVWLFMHTHEGLWGGSGVAMLEEIVNDDLLPGVVEAALDAVQNDVAKATHGIAWPSDPQSSVPLPPPWASVENGVLSFGYGSRSFATDLRLVDLAL